MLSDCVQASMFRMADEFAFPKRLTKRRFSLQLFKTQSTNPKAWVGPLREELTDIYKKLNQAIARYVCRMKVNSGFEIECRFVVEMRK